MTENVSRANTIIQCHHVAYNTELGIHLLVSKHAGESFVCVSDTMSDDVSYMVLEDASKDVDWTFPK